MGSAVGGECGCEWLPWGVRCMGDGLWYVACVVVCVGCEYWVCVVWVSDVPWVPGVPWVPDIP